MDLEAGFDEGERVWYMFCGTEAGCVAARVSVTVSRNTCGVFTMANSKSGGSVIGFGFANADAESLVCILCVVCVGGNEDVQRIAAEH